MFKKESSGQFIGNIKVSLKSINSYLEESLKGKIPVNICWTVLFKIAKDVSILTMKFKGNQAFLQFLTFLRSGAGRLF